MNSLKKKGLLKDTGALARSLFVEKEQTSSLYTVPLVGHYSLERGIEIDADVSKCLDLPPHFVPNPERTYILQATGDLLNELIIAEGDLLIVEARRDIEVSEMAIGKEENRHVITDHPSPSMRIDAVLIAVIRVHQTLARSPLVSSTSSQQSDE